MLIRLLRTYLRPARWLLVAVFVLQFAQTIATLTLPSINAGIVDKGIVRNDSHYIWTRGALMLAITFVQVVCAVAAVYFGSRAAMGMGRDVRSGLFHHVTGFSTREVNEF